MWCARALAAAMATALVFHAQAKSTVAAAPAAPSSSARATEQAAEQAPKAIDVVVEGAKLPSSSGAAAAEEELKKRDVARLPGAFGDAFRAVEVLPGVAPLATGLPHLFVRGANPSSTGYFINGVQVPFLFHLAVGPSVVNPAIIDAVKFHPGGYPAQYSRHTGGIVAATTRRPAKRWRAEATVRLFDAGAFVETPLIAKRFTAFAAARYAYTGPMLSLIAPDTRLSYWDYQVGGAVKLNALDQVAVFAFGSHDYLGKIDADDRETELFGVSFHRVQLRLERRPRIRLIDGKEDPLGARAALSFTFGNDRSGLGDQGEMGNRSYHLRTDVELPFGARVRLRAGIDLLAEELHFDAPGSATDKPTEKEEPEPGEDEFEFDITQAFGSRGTATAGAYSDLVLRPSSAVEIVTGLRLDVFTEEDASQMAVEPRGMIRLRPWPFMALVSAAGLMHQRPALIVPVPGLSPSGLKDGLQRAIQVSQGVELSLPWQMRLGATGFYHHYHDLTDLTATCSAGVMQCSIVDRADGRSYGLELSLRRSFSERVGGLLAYTLSRSERAVESERFLSDFDRTHVLNLALGVDLGRRWHVGGRLTAYSGRPYSFIAIDDPEKPNDPTLIGKRNALRRPGFYRIDLRVEKRWVIRKSGWVSLIFELLNATFRSETVDFDCRVAEVVGSQSGLECGGQELGPISIPSVGVSGGF